MLGGVVHGLVHQNPARYRELFAAKRDPGEDLVAWQLRSGVQLGIGNYEGGGKDL